MNKSWGHFKNRDTFQPIEMFPEWKEAINKTLPIWNFAEENFYKQVDVYKFIVSALTKWVSEDIIKYWYNYFWEKVILDAFETYKDNVSDRFRNQIKNMINDLLDNKK